MHGANVRLGSVTRSSYSRSRTTKHLPLFEITPSSVHRLSARASVNLDFSMKHDFPDGVEVTLKRIGAALERTFRAAT